MKANELIYGIYVYFNCFDDSKIIVKVTGFKDDFVYGVSEYGTHWCQVSKIEPIPLTEEILIKNGFPEDEWHGSFPEDKDGLLYIVLSFNKIFWEFNDYRIELKSVHQLQHILRDLGIEKEIEL
jgi:hypothetical protein